MSNIGVVITTFNRIEKLKIALQAFDSQTIKPDYIVVVNNASTDATPALLEEWKKQSTDYEKYVITTERNLGGSGGFYTGLEFAQKQKSDWIWVSDDDAFPEKDALEVASNYITSHNMDNISAICSSVINNGKYDFIHRVTWKPKLFTFDLEYSTLADYQKSEFEINSFSYVGAIINRKKMKKVGLTQKDYFIWCDDGEHSLRLSKVGKIICVPSIRVHHDVTESGEGVSWKEYYGARNQLDQIRRNFPKRYYYYRLCQTYLKSRIKLLSHRGNRDRNLMTLKAIKDVRHNKFGIDDVYKPGWKPTNNK